jgi:hypothetical protein
MTAAAYFTYAAELLKANPPHITDQSIIARMKRIGIDPGRSFSFDKLDPTVQEALEKAAVDGLKEMNDLGSSLGKTINGWQMNTDPMGYTATTISSGPQLPWEAWVRTLQRMQSTRHHSWCRRPHSGWK